MSKRQKLFDKELIERLLKEKDSLSDILHALELPRSGGNCFTTLKNNIKRVVGKWEQESEDMDMEIHDVHTIKEDLAVWFGTKKKPKGSTQPKGPWVNICRKVDGKHPPCGRSEADTKGYPKCRAVGVAGKMSDSQKQAACAQKRRAEKKDPKIGTGNKPTMTSYKPKKK